MKRGSGMQVKVPCNDEADFYARLADHIAENGLRIPAERPRRIGDRLRLALEFRDGSTLSGEAVVAAHVRLDDRAGVNVRFVRFDRPAPAATPNQQRPSAAAPPGPSRPPAPVPPSAGDAAVPEIAQEECESLDGLAASGGDVAGRVTRMGAPRRWWLALRGRRRTAVAAATAAALALAVLGYVVVRRHGSPEAEAADHLAAAERQLAAGRVTGADGALEHLLAAKRLRPRDPAPAARLVALADMLEGLGTRALERGDLEVASIHLEAARIAAPERTSVRKKLEAVAKSRRSASKARRERAPGGGAKP